MGVGGVGAATADGVSRKAVSSASLIVSRSPLHRHAQHHGSALVFSGDGPGVSHAAPGFKEDAPVLTTSNLARRCAPSRLHDHVRQQGRPRRNPSIEVSLDTGDRSLTVVQPLYGEELARLPVAVTRASVAVTCMTISSSAGRALCGTAADAVVTCSCSHRLASCVARVGTGGPGDAVKWSVGGRSLRPSQARVVWCCADDLGHIGIYLGIPILHRRSAILRGPNGDGASDCGSARRTARG